MLHGVLTFEKNVPVPTGTQVRIQVEDTSRANASALPVAETLVTVPEDFDSGKDALPFEIFVPGLITDGLTVRAHLARHDGSDIRRGDMITMESIPLRADGSLRVPLRAVT